VIQRIAQAGTLESSDCLVTVSPAPTLELEWRGATSALFAERNRALVESVLKETGLSGVKVQLQDQGALELTLRSRLKTALERARKEGARC